MPLKWKEAEHDILMVLKNHELDLAGSIAVLGGTIRSIALATGLDPKHLFNLMIETCEEIEELKAEGKLQ